MIADKEYQFAKGFPRTRGDRPVAELVAAGYERVGGSPARAGIDPFRAFQAGFPRTRGDRPEAVGSPARAGIDPTAMLEHQHTGFPRTRGDRPAHDWLGHRFPRTRGSPARAGIDPRTPGIDPMPMQVASVPPHARG